MEYKCCNGFNYVSFVDPTTHTYIFSIQSYPMSPYEELINEKIDPDKDEINEYIRKKYEHNERVLNSRCQIVIRGGQFDDVVLVNDISHRCVRIFMNMFAERIKNDRDLRHLVVSVTANRWLIEW